jgi:hypothetical protein
MANPGEMKVPDGGYGWLVMACALVCNTIATSVAMCNSMLMIEYSETFGASQTVIGWTGGMYGAVYGLSGM